MSILALGRVCGGRRGLLDVELNFGRGTTGTTVSLRCQFELWTIDYVELSDPLHDDFDFRHGAAGYYGIPYMSILTLAGGTQGVYGVPHMSILASGRGYGGRRGPLDIELNLGRGTTGTMGSIICGL